MLETELYIVTGQVKPEAFIFSQPSPLGTGRDTKRTYIMPRKQSRIVEIVRWLKRVTYGQMSPQVCRPQVGPEEVRGSWESEGLEVSQEC